MQLGRRRVVAIGKVAEAIIMVLLSLEGSDLCS